VGCSRARGRQVSAKLVPADALVVLSVNWQAVRGDGDLLALIKGAEFKKVLADIGVDEEAITDLLVFGDGASSSHGSTGMLLSGSFDAHAVAESLKKRGWRRETYGGHGFYINPADGVALAALNSGVLVCGTKKGVESVIRAESDPNASFASKDAYKRLSKLFYTAKSPISMVIAFPQQFQDAADAALQVSSVMMDFAGVGPLGQLMSKIGYSRAIGCSIGHEGNSFPVELMAVMKDEDAAAFVSGGLTLLKGIGALAGQPSARSSEEAEAIRTFQNMSISRKNDVLSIRLVMSRKNLLPN
jgi:hypothetical protein